MKRVLITGATSGIGRELAVQFSRKGYLVAVTGRRTHLLESLKAEIGDALFFRTVDVADLENAEIAYRELIDEMGGMDIMILNAGVGTNKKLSKWQSEEKIIQINALAFAHGCHFAFEFFKKQGHGQIVGITSITSLLASHYATAYCATKHFARNYLTGYRQKARRANADITVTEICPGFVTSEMTAKNKKMFWVAPVEKAASQMVSAIEKRKNLAYITRRWRLIAWVAGAVPQWLWNRL